MARKKVEWWARRRWTRENLEELASSPELLRGEIRNHPKALVRIAHAAARQIEKQRKIFGEASRTYKKDLGSAFENLLGTTDTKKLKNLTEAELNSKRSLLTQVTKVMTAVRAFDPKKVANDVGRYVDFMEDMAERVTGDRSQAWNPNFSWSEFYRVFHEFEAQNPALAEMIEGGTNEIQAQLYTIMYSNGSMSIQDTINTLSEELQNRGGLDINGNLRLGADNRPINISRSIPGESSDKWRSVRRKSRRFP